jgi:hypothetical protein
MVADNVEGHWYLILLEKLLSGLTLVAQGLLDHFK